MRRVLLLWRHIDGRRYRPSLAALAETFQVHTRTVRRDLALLEELHFDVPPPLPATALDELADPSAEYHTNLDVLHA